MSGFWTDEAVREALGPADLIVRPAAGVELHAAAVSAPAEEPGMIYSGVSTDTRSLGESALFVALRGERFDAHDFLAEAAAAGARGAVVERIPEGAPADLVYYQVPDTLVALGALARHYRRQLGARVVAIVGSNGKTTTKEMVRGVLSIDYRVHATAGTLNNLIGVPLTLLGAPLDTEALVVEVGTNAPGEVARLGAIVEPDAVIITSIAEEHLEGLIDLDGVLREETAILAALPADGVALIVEEPSALVERAGELAPRVRVAGLGEDADQGLRAKEVRLDAEGRVAFRWRGHDLQLGFRGRANARNAVLALGLGEEWGIAEETAVAALAEVETPAMRSEFSHYGELTVIADCYNSNPASLEAAVDLLGALPRRGGRVAVLGTMREMGLASEDLHRRSAALVAGLDLDLIVATGEFVAAFEPFAAGLGERLLRVEDPVAAYAPLSRRLRGSETVLLKGSRGVALERLLPLLEQDFGGSAIEAGTPSQAGGDAGRVRGE
jgi:UDP-N-acetylmuramoyl-tripeptide--D-alanyl-D-alanine ligase